MIRTQNLTIPSLMRPPNHKDTDTTTKAIDSAIRSPLKLKLSAWVFASCKQWKWDQMYSISHMVINLMFFRRKEEV